jgi:hypothetical protein
MNCTEHSSWLKEIINSALIPFMVGTISFLLFRGWDERIKRINYSRLGIIIIRSLLEEVNTGIGIIKANLPNKTVQLQNMPSASWININTIPDEVLLRIISISEKVTQTGDYHPRDIRSHTKNYFEHMCFTWAQKANLVADAINKKMPIPSDLHDTAVAFQRPAEHVKILLEQTIQLLDRNSKRWCPK